MNDPSRRYPLRDPRGSSGLSGNEDVNLVASGCPRAYQSFAYVSSARQSPPVPQSGLVRGGSGPLGSEWLRLYPINVLFVCLSPRPRRTDLILIGRILAHDFGGFRAKWNPS